MPRRLSLLPSCLLVACLLSSTAMADDEQVTLSFLLFPALEEEASLQLKTGETTQIDVDTPSQEISKPYQVAKMGQWTIGKTRTRLANNPMFVDFASCPALDSPEQLIIIEKPNNPLMDHYQLIAVDSRQSEFQGGSLLLINRTNIRISPKIGQATATINPKDYAILSPKIAGDKAVLQSEISMEKDGEMKLMINTRWPLSRSSRSIIIFYQDKDGRVLMHTARQLINP